uniref:Protein sickie n=1 Tax=Anopheles stephensi TaxID=30069 RepID=A0A182YFX4_ANOST
MMLMTGLQLRRQRQLPVPYAKAGVNGGTAIPLPATVLVTRRCPPDKVRPLPPTPNQQTGLHGGLQKHTLGTAGGISTPSDGNSCPGSPQHHNGTAIITQIPKGNNSLRLPQATNCKIPASPYSASNTLQHNNHHHNNNNNTITLIPNGNVTNIPTNPAQQQQPQHQKHSMLDKFKLFNSKEKQDRSAQKSQISKRTSSSSGFSSARSERSDSSLSLDNGHHQGSLQPTVTPSSAIPGAKIKESGLKKLDSSASKSSPSSTLAGKSSTKLISSKSSSKESAKAAAKAEKQRQLDPTAAAPQTHIPLAPQKAQKIPMATTVTTNSLATAVGASAMAPKVQDSSRLKLGSVGRKLDAKSESKTSLHQQPQLMAVPQSPKTMVCPQQQQQQQQQQQMQQQSAVGTGIPKPMAAIKGTSKPSQQLLTPTGGATGKEELTVCKPATVGAIVQPQIPNNNNANGQAISVSGNNNTMMGQLLQQQQQQQQQHQQLMANGASNGGMSDSMHSNSTQGASMGQHSTNSSETSSVVAYRPSSESGSEQLLQSPQKLHPSNGSAGPLVYGGQPDVNLNNGSNNGSSSPGHVFHNGNGNLHHSSNNNHNSNTANNNNNLNKFHTVPTKMLNCSSPVAGNQTTIYEQEEKQITVLPMRPLLRGYNSHVTLPTRGTRGHHPHHPQVHHHHQLMAADYCEDFGGPGGGYCSDGDALRKIPARYSDNIDNGYLSEGGGGGGGSASILTSAGRQQHASYISSLRARTQLPTTIEER